MWKLKSDKGFLEFLSSEGRALKLGGLMLLGLILILIGNLGTRSGDVTSQADQTAEERVAEMCSLMDGVGECRVMMTYSPDSDGGEVYAVLVLCDGADSVTVRERITSLFTSLYGIGAHRVEIQRLNNK